MAESGDKLRRLRANIDALEAEFCRTAREFPGSQAIEVGRATRVVSAPTRRALRARDQGCRWPGCDRPVEWTSPHHIRFWTRQGGPTNLANLVSVCHFHHRQVHEGGWKVVKVGRELQFLPPDRQLFGPARGPGVRQAA